MNEYTLTYREICFADVVAYHRQIISRAAVAKNRHLAFRKEHVTAQLEAEVVGARAEFAFSLMTGLPWHCEPWSVADVLAKVKPNSNMDVGKWQVRSTRLHRGGLIVYPWDKPDWRFVLMRALDKGVQRAATFQLVGWMSAQQARQPRYWQTRKLRIPAHLVPWQHLSPFSFPTVLSCPKERAERNDQAR